MISVAHKIKLGTYFQSAMVRLTNLLPGSFAINGGGALAFGTATIATAAAAPVSIGSEKDATTAQSSCPSWWASSSRSNTFSSRLDFSWLTRAALIADLDLSFVLTANPDKSCSRSSDRHDGHAGGVCEDDRTKTSKSSRHPRHLYSKIGMLGTSGFLPTDATGSLGGRRPDRCAAPYIDRCLSPYRPHPGIVP